MSQEKIQYGIDTHPEPSAHSNLKRMLKIPFEKKRTPLD
jgi:hypothetical protein